METIMIVNRKYRNQRTPLLNVVEAGLQRRPEMKAILIAITPGIRAAAVAMSMKRIVQKTNNKGSRIPRNFTLSHILYIFIISICAYRVTMLLFVSYIYI